MIGYDSSVAAEKAKGKKNQAKIQKARLDHDHDPYAVRDMQDDGDVPIQ